MLIIGEIGEVVKIALSVAYRKQSIIYFLIAPMLDFCGLRYICYLEFLGRQISTICLIKERIQVLV